jgi:hypothetical protein
MQAIWLVIAAWIGVSLGLMAANDDEEIRFSDCPAAARKTIQLEAKEAKIETVTRTKTDSGEIIYRTDLNVAGKVYAIGVLEDGTLSELILAVADEELPMDRCPRAVQSTFRNEAFGEKLETVGKDMKYGVIIYQTVVNHQAKSYQIVVAEDGTLVEKVLVIKDEEIELAKCPAAVRAALHRHADGGEIGDITRSTGIGQNTFEAEVKIRAKVYLIEVNESGLLISKTLEAIRE